MVDGTEPDPHACAAWHAGARRVTYSTRTWKAPIALRDTTMYKVSESALTVSLCDMHTQWIPLLPATHSAFVAKIPHDAVAFRASGPRLSLFVLTTCSPTCHARLEPWASVMGRFTSRHVYLTCGANASKWVRNGGAARWAITRGVTHGQGFVIFTIFEANPSVHNPFPNAPFPLSLLPLGAQINIGQARRCSYRSITVLAPSVTRAVASTAREEMASDLGRPPLKCSSLACHGLAAYPDAFL